MRHKIYCIILILTYSSHRYQFQLEAQKLNLVLLLHPISCGEIQILIMKSVSIQTQCKHSTYFFEADMSFEGDTSEGSKNSNSNDGGAGGDADLVYFDESEMRLF